MIRSHFAGGVSEHGDMQKGSLQRVGRNILKEIL